MAEHRVLHTRKRRQLGAVQPGPRLGQVLAVLERARLRAARPPGRSPGAWGRSRTAPPGASGTTTHFHGTFAASSTRRGSAAAVVLLAHQPRRPQPAAADATSRSSIPPASATAWSKRARSASGVSCSSQRAFRAPTTPLTVAAVAVDQRLEHLLAAVVGVDGRHDRLVQLRRQLGIPTAHTRAELAPDQPERRVADPVGRISENSR